MAKRRMFSMEIADSDAFLDMPPSAQNLYFHLGLRADDDGFVNNVNTITRMCQASKEDLQLLYDKRYLLKVDGVSVIKHWRINNQIRADRKAPTKYQDELVSLYIKPNGAYTDHPTDDNQTTTKRQPNDNQMTTKCEKVTPQYSIGEDSIGEDSIERSADASSARFVKPTKYELAIYCTQKCLDKVDIDQFLNYYESVGWMVGKKKMKDWKAAVRNWNARQKEFEKPKKANKGIERETDYDAFIRDKIGAELIGTQKEKELEVNHE